MFAAMLGVTLGYSAYSNLLANHTPHGLLQSTGFDYSNPTHWQRIIRMRALDPNSSWSPTGYTANQILSMISDMRPTMLDRYTSGPQNPSALVPVCSGCSPMTVQQFLQASEDTSSAVIMARLSIWDYDNGTLFNESQGLLSIQVNPPIRILSIDDYNGWIKIHNAMTWTSISQQLLAQGWILLETGGHGDSSGIVPTGTTNYGSSSASSPCWCVSPSNGWFSKPGIKYVLQSLSFPSDMATLQSMSFDQLKSIFTNLAGNQTLVGYHMIYFIIQGNWDTTKMVGSNGQSLYEVMRNLMATYNSVPSPGPPPGPNNCFWCTSFAQLGSSGWLLAFGIALGLLATLTLLYVKARGSLGRARRMTHVAGRVIRVWS